MLAAFVEDHNSDKVDPTASGCVGFDFAAVEAALGELQATPETRDRLALLVRVIFGFAVGSVNLARSDALRSIGKRTLAMAWVVDPSLLNNDSLRSIAKQLGCTAANLAPLTAEFSRLTGLSNQFKAHDWRKDQQHEAVDQR